MKGLGRTLLWLLFYLVLLGFPSVEAKYNDGLTVRLHGWGEKLKGKK